jgi:phosphoribosyl 1,2-cyclic phosphate phosphodiesterase
MRIQFLGTGTSAGVPCIGCDCAVCSSDDPRNKRLRASLYVEAGGTHILVDTPPDFRTQALTYRVPRVDAVLLTHAHADHILGFDDIRRYNTMQGCVIPTYGSPETLADMRKTFDYVGTEPVPGFYRPLVEFVEVAEPFVVGEVQVEPLLVTHSPGTAYGYRFEVDGLTVGYVPDCNGMSGEVVSRLAGVDVMVLDALKYKPHRSHFTVDESVAVLQQIGAGRSFLTHMCHALDHAETEKNLPESIRLAYDGLTLEW